MNVEFENLSRSQSDMLAKMLTDLRKMRSSIFEMNQKIERSRRAVDQSYEVLRAWERRPSLREMWWRGAR
jgi:hypothetical protein